MNFPLALAAAALLASLCACASPEFTGDYEPGPRPEMRDIFLTGRIPANVQVLKAPDGRPAYLVTAPCCDQFNPLYDADDRYVCAPSGGLAGHGDGSCPTWVTAALRGERDPLTRRNPPTPS